MEIVFVCTGNTCRSPMAEVMAEAVLKNNAIDADVKSRGIFANDGEPASEYAKLAVINYGLSLEEHTSKQISMADIQNAELILTMTDGHKKMLESICPKDKLFTIKEYCTGEQGDVLDPFGGSVDTYMECAKEIADCVSFLPEKLKSI